MEKSINFHNSINKNQLSWMRIKVFKYCMNEWPERLISFVLSLSVVWVCVVKKFLQKQYINDPKKGLLIWKHIEMYSSQSTDLLKKLFFLYIYIIIYFSGQRHRRPSVIIAPS